MTTFPMAPFPQLEHMHSFSFHLPPTRPFVFIPKDK